MAGEPAMAVTRVDVVVLLALAGLAAGVAVPRQAGIATEARRAQVVALARSAGSAAALAHAQWESRNRPPALPGARGLVAMVNGYPSAATLPLLLADVELQLFRHDAGRFSHRDIKEDAEAADCGVAYAPPADSGAPPTVTTRTDGC